MSVMKPSVYIGSSTEGIEFARAVRLALYADAEITVWKDGFFGLGDTYIEALLNGLTRFDFAILILTPDDLIQSRGVETLGPRDNVLFELGLFMGHLGKGRTFIVHQANATTKLPSDLSGVTTASYQWPYANHNYVAAVGAACDQIRQIIRDLGISEFKANKRIDKIDKRQDALESRLRTLQFVVKGLVTTYEHEKLEGLAGSNPFLVYYHPAMIGELQHLDAMRYVQPNAGYGIESIRERKGYQNKFDLKQYVRITDEGKEYLKLRAEMLVEW